MKVMGRRLYRHLKPLKHIQKSPTHSIHIMTVHIHHATETLVIVGENTEELVILH